MLPGFNHNVRYRGQTFHVQTEDKGLNNPIVVSQVFLAGHVLASEQSAYGDLLNREVPQAERAEQVRARMQELHKNVLRRLIGGHYDQTMQVGSPATTLETPQPPAATLETPQPPAPSEPTLPTPAEVPAAQVSQPTHTTTATHNPTEAQHVASAMEHAELVPTLNDEDELLSAIAREVEKQTSQWAALGALTQKPQDPAFLTLPDLRPEFEELVKTRPTAEVPTATVPIATKPAVTAPTATKPPATAPVAAVSAATVRVEVPKQQHAATAPTRPTDAAAIVQKALDPANAETLLDIPVQKLMERKPQTKTPKKDKPVVERTLDDVILSYLYGDSD